MPDVNRNTITGALYNFQQDIKKGKIKGITIPERGLYVWEGYNREDESQKEPSKGPKVREEDFYEAFKDYIIQELGECTKAVVLGKRRNKICGGYTVSYNSFWSSL